MVTEKKKKAETFSDTIYIYIYIISRKQYTKPWEMGGKNQEVGSLKTKVPSKYMKNNSDYTNNKAWKIKRNTTKLWVHQFDFTTYDSRVQLILERLRGIIEKKHIS